MPEQSASCSYGRHPPSAALSSGMAKSVDSQTRDFSLSTDSSPLGVIGKAASPPFTYFRKPSEAEAYLGPMVCLE